MRKTIFILCIVFTFMIGGGCAQNEKPALMIGDIEISAKEFDDAFHVSRFASLGDAGREAFLEEYINKKLLLREAEKQGLHKNPEFLRDIQFFWEQALLKLIFSKKTKELASSVQVTDQEVKDYYRQHKEADFPDKELSAVYDQLKWILLREKQNRAIVDWSEALRKKTTIAVDDKKLGIKR